MKLNEYIYIYIEKGWHQLHSAAYELMQSNADGIGTNPRRAHFNALSNKENHEHRLIKIDS